MGSWTGTIPATTANLAGNNAYIGDTLGSFDGKIDDVKVWNYARTGEQIYQDYVRGTKHEE